MTFVTSVETTGIDRDALRWRLEIVRVDGADRVLTRVFTGSGPPPERLQWDGTESGTNLGLFERGALYEGRLVVSDGAYGTASSAPVVIGSSWGAGGEALARWTLRERLFTDEPKPTVKLRTALARAKRTLDQNKGGLIVVEVHTDASELDART